MSLREDAARRLSEATPTPDKIAWPPLISGLLRPAAYPHPVQSVEVRETHISWVLLTGEFAYKIKKPVDLGFVDFTTLARREQFCHEEIRLNRRFAPDLYLDVVPIRLDQAGYCIAPGGEPIEFAVRMRQFAESDIATQRLASGRLTAADVDALAHGLAAVHGTADRAGEGRWGTPAQVIRPALENFEALRSSSPEKDAAQQCLDEVAVWTNATFNRLEETFSRRLGEGMVRECHGDLHLGNIVSWQGVLTPFDCIEFNPSFRWIDVMSEIAFLIMDLDDHARPDLAGRFLNRYLEATGDYMGLAVLPFYLVYRALVRAKVDMLRLQQGDLSREERQRLAWERNSYLDLAARYTAPHDVSLTITHGVSGSGKSTGSQRLIEQAGSIRVRSDIERKRICGIESGASSPASVDEGLYDPEVSARTYERLAQLAEVILRAGFPVVVDATFLHRAQRQTFRKLAETLGVPFHILAFTADVETLRQRIRQRAADGGDPSDATVRVLEHQLRTCESLTAEEEACVTSPAALGREPEAKPDS